MMESVKAFGSGAVLALLPYSVIAVYVLNMWDVHLRGQYSFRELVLAELLLIAFASIGAHVGFMAAGEAKSLIWAATSALYALRFFSVRLLVGHWGDIAWSRSV